MGGGGGLQSVTFIKMIVQDFAKGQNHKRLWKGNMHENAGEVCITLGFFTRFLTIPIVLSIKSQIYTADTEHKLG